MNQIVGRVLCNQYQVLEKIGQGGMADVYKVFDLDGDVYKAIKVLHKELVQDASFTRRFRREADTLKRLKHDNIVRFFAIEGEEDLVFMVLGYVDGETLRNQIYRCEGKSLTYDRIQEILNPICRALNYAHNKKFVHCDVKPENVMVDSGNKVFLTDFGISRVIDTYTTSYSQIGTPAYMAPEQIKGFPAPRPQTDIYALGILLYEMVTGGERPFKGECASIPGTTKDKIFWEHLNYPAPSPMKYNRNLSPRVEAVIMRCLQKDPLRRYSSTIHMYNELITAKPIKISADTHEGHLLYKNRKAKTWEQRVSNRFVDRYTFNRKEKENQRRARVLPDATHQPGMRWLLIIPIAITLITVIYFSFHSLLDRNSNGETSVAINNSQSTIGQDTDATKTYSINECMPLTLEGNNRLVECLESIEIQSDGSLKLHITWTAHLDGLGWITRHSDLGNRNMFLIDDQNNRYDHIQVGGEASRDTQILNNRTSRGWYVFPRLNDQAQYIIFYDDDNNSHTQPIARSWP